jgi:hypothetical protein
MYKFIIKNSNLNKSHYQWHQLFPSRALEMLESGEGADCVIEVHQVPYEKAAMQQQQQDVQSISVFLKFNKFFQISNRFQCFVSWVNAAFVESTFQLKH